MPKYQVSVSSIYACPANLRKEQCVLQAGLQKTNDGFRIISGHRRIEAALTISDEIKVNAIGIGEVMIAKLPDGVIAAQKAVKDVTGILRSFLGLIAVVIVGFLPAISVAAGNSNVTNVEFLVVFDGPAWSHGTYIQQFEGKTFGPPISAMLMTVGHQDTLRFQPKDGACVLVQMRPKATAVNALSLDVDLLECSVDDNELGHSRHTGTTAASIPLVLKQSASVRYDDASRVRFVTQRFIGAND